jgi:hypothetical protein
MQSWFSIALTAGGVGLLWLGCCLCFWDRRGYGVVVCFVFLTFLFAVSSLYVFVSVS